MVHRSAHVGVSWQPELDDLARRQAAAAELGGAERVARHRDSGKRTVRERIDLLVDAESFREIGSASGFAEYNEAGELVEFSPANFIFGQAKINASPVVVAGDDFTVRGGSADAAIYAKLVYSEQLARELQVPLVRLVDGSGGGGSVKTYHEIGRTYVPPLPGWADQMAILSEVPVVAAAMGSVAGLGAARVAGSHFSIMVDGTSQIFIAGPPIVQYATHETVDKEALGGARMQTANGTVDNLADTEEDALNQIGRFLAFLPRSVWELPRRSVPIDDRNRREETLLSFMPRNRRTPYDPRALIELIFDQETFFEIGRRWGRSLVTGLTDLNGYAVGVLASDPTETGGVLTADAADKLRRFLDLCDTFHIPIVSLVDQPGFAVGTEAESVATLRRGVGAIAALYQLTVPFYSVIVRRAFGVAGAAFVDRGEPDLRVAWPSGDWGSLPLEGGIEAAYRRDLEASDDKETLRKELEDSFEAVRSPFRTAETFDIQEIIDPRDTRPLLCDWIEIAYGTMRPGPKTRGFRP